MPVITEKRPLETSSIARRLASYPASCSVTTTVNSSGDPALIVRDAARVLIGSFHGKQYQAQRESDGQHSIFSLLPTIRTEWGEN